MAEDDATPKIIEVTSDENKSPQDLEAEIAQTAAKLGGEKKTKPVTTATKNTTKKATTKKAATAAKKPTIKLSQRKAIAEPPTEDTPTSQAPDTPQDQPSKPLDSEEHIIAVRSTTKKVIAPVSPAVKTTQKKSDTTKNTAAKTQEPKPVKPVADESEHIKVRIAPKASPSIPKDRQPQEEPIQPEEQPSEPDTQDDPDTGTETSQKLSELSSELADTVTDKALKNSEAQQHTKVYDTQKYHLPIKPNRHHRSSALPLWVQMLILIVLVAGGAYYVLQTDLIDQITSLL